jgi:hypothetical protein
VDDRQEYLLEHITEEEETTISPPRRRHSSLVPLT